MELANVGEGHHRARFGRKRRAAVVAVASGLLLAGAACSDRENATISSAGTIAAQPTATGVPTPEVTPVPVDERVYRNHIASLSTTLRAELSSLGQALSDPQDTEEWLRGLNTNITQVNTQLDLLRQLSPPSERYLPFDTALDTSLDEYIAAMEALTAALQASDPELITAAGTQLAGAGESFEAAVALFPPE